MQIEVDMDPPEVSLTARTKQRVSWKTVIWWQDWASIAATTLIIIPLAVTSFYTHVKDRSFVVYDGSLSLPYYPNSTIPAWVAVLVPSISMLMSVITIEILGASSRNVSATWAVASALHFLIDFVGVFVVNGTLTETTKLMVGRFRPDWLARCSPSVPKSGVTPTYGLPASDNPACHSTLADSKLQDGHKSFPSGHSSTAFSLGTYCAIYVLWATYHRSHNAGSLKQYGQMVGTWREGFVRGIGSFLAFVWAFSQLCWAWGVAISRIMDDKHHPSDVIAGAFLGTLVASFFLARSIPHSVRLTQTDHSQEYLLYGRSQIPNSNDNL